MLTVNEIESALTGGTELRGFEIKGPLPSTDRRFLAKVARAALSMGNHRDGGHVVIGIADEQLAEMQPGLDDDQLASWLSFDDVSRRIGRYADPPLRFRVEAFELSSGASVVQMEVAEFDSAPHLCAADYDDVLRRGALYTRSATLPETAEIGRHSEMRELLEIATEKALRAYIGTAERAGVRLSKAADPFRSEREGIWDE